MIDKKQALRIDSGQVEHIAKLARIELTEKEKRKFSDELSSILDYVDKLNKVDTKNIKPIQQITGLENIVRKDEINHELRINDKLLDGAPDKKDNYYKVPKIFE